MGESSSSRSVSELQPISQPDNEGKDMARIETLGDDAAGRSSNEDTHSVVVDGRVAKKANRAADENEKGDLTKLGSSSVVKDTMQYKKHTQREAAPCADANTPSSMSLLTKQINLLAY